MSLDLVRLRTLLPVGLTMVLPTLATGQGASASSAGVRAADTTRRVLPDSLDRDTTQGADSVLNVDLLGRLEFKGERTSNDRCFQNQIYSLTFRCSSRLTPQIDFQFSLRSAGMMADRVRVGVDYDSQREFDGSNTISLQYLGKPGDILEKVEVGNVKLQMPTSRFLTSGVPSGNFGIQATGRVGSLRFGAIAAQQRGNVVRDTIFLIGGQAARISERTIHDYQIEARRFFFVVDPALFAGRYPNLDILDADGMQELARSLPDSLRPSKVSLYRLLIGGQPPNPNGPRFTLLDEPDASSGQVYERLREGVDYYIDPSQLWVALARPLSLANERLVAAWTLNIGGRDTVIARLGGTPDLEFRPDRVQYAHRLWDPYVMPGDPSFRHEIRSVYRLGGSDIRRETVSLRIVTGTGGDQEKPPGAPKTWLELFRMARPGNSALFDAVNRIWPREQDPNFLLDASAVSPTLLIRDAYIVFPSLEPFSRRGLATGQGVVPNDTIYRTPGEYLYSSEHPQSFYRILAGFESSGAMSPGTIALASSQIRPGSERLFIEGRPLIPHVDYEIDYDLGTVRLLTADSLATRPRKVTVQYEENPLFTPVPTSVAALTADWTLPFGSVAFTAISQKQRSNFTRPPLGFEPQGSFVAGMSANFGWDLPGLSRQLGRFFPAADDNAASRLDLTAEVAVSQPRQGGAQQAYIESFEGSGGAGINLLDSRWQLSSQPALGSRLPELTGAAILDTLRAATMAFQNYGTDRDGRAVTFTVQQIDPQTTLAGGTVAGFEQVLWMTLYPLTVGGLTDPVTGQARWRIRNVPGGRRWRSVRTVLGSGGTGIDLTRGEFLEFWTLVDTAAAARGRNPMLVMDFGDVSENSVAWGPDTLTVVEGDSLYTGRSLQGWNRLDSERDAFSRAFSADVNDVGLPGHVVEELTVLREGVPRRAVNFPVCRLGTGRLLPLGDSRIDCTVRNSRLDEEDIDQDAVLNYRADQREQERIRRFIVDLSRPTAWNRVGACGITINDVNQAFAPGAQLCWVQVKVPFSAPDDSVAGGPVLRRVRALRVTVVSGRTTPDDRYTMVPLARLRVTGASWRKRAARPLRGLGGVEETTGGFVIASSIGTQDRDSTRGLVYEPPPGVTDAPDQQQSGIGLAGVSINETSMRLLAGELPLHGRAEAFLRFPEGDRNVMSYRELRVWARGRGRGWGQQGDLEFFIKLGRDANNFYAYHTRIFSGPGRAAWEPEIRIPFERFYALRARLEAAYLQGNTDWLGCTSADSAMIGASALPPSASGTRHAACDGGFVIYSVDPVVTPPNLASVQEIAAGILRVDSLSGINPPGAGDTVEVWIDDIRLADVEQRAGLAGMLGATLNAGDAGSIRVTATRTDPWFRQLAERPGYSASNNLEIFANWRLDKLLPWRTGLAVPLTVTHEVARMDPEFLERSDLQGAAIEDLRFPRSGTTTVTLAARRTTPLEGSWLAPVVNHLGVTTAWHGTAARTAYQSGRTRGFDIGLDYLFDGSTPGVASGSSGIRPSVLRLVSNLERSRGSATAFVRPTLAGGSESRRTGSLEHLWQSSSNLEFRPYPGITARWDARSTRDLRDYGTLTPNTAAASRERGSLAGMDVGLERERVLSSSVLYTPFLGAWIRPRLELSSGYSLLRDPFAPGIPDPDTDELQLTRRFGNSQRVTASAALDFIRATEGEGEGSWIQHLGRFLGVVDMSVGRDQLTAFDAAPMTPNWRYQFGVGSFADYREVAARLAASAGRGTRYSVSNTFSLPWGATLAQRIRMTRSTHWTRRQKSHLSMVDGDQVVYPDLTLRWSGRPIGFSDLISNVALTARAVHTRQSFSSPADSPETSAERRSTRARTYPVSFTVLGRSDGLSLSLGYSWSSRVDSLPGSVGDSRSTDATADLTRTFPLPRSWELPGGLRTRLSYQHNETRSYVSNLAVSTLRSRLTDNGRTAVSLNADTDLADNMTFSLQASRVVTFDRNFNRRFTQTVLSAVLNIRFFGGVL